jgi:hypothetical protein
MDLRARRGARAAWDIQACSTRRPRNNGATSSTPTMCRPVIEGMRDRGFGRIITYVCVCCDDKRSLVRGENARIFADILTHHRVLCKP